MKKPHVLNRAMFNQGGTSAYGKGITSNLVSDEQRQRFNYGGRVKLQDPYAFNMMSYDPNPWGNKPWEGIDRTKELTWGDVGSVIDPAMEERASRRRLGQLEEEEAKEGLLGLEDPLEYQAAPDDIIEADKKIEVADRGDVMTDSDWMELLGPTEEQKKRTKGKTQLSLAAGALDVFSRPTTAKKMQAAVPHLTKLGETATAQEDAIDKAILQGKVLEKVYKGRETEKGKQARETLKTKTDIITASENPRTRYYAGLDAKIGMKKSMEEALGYPIQTVKKDKKTKAPIIPEGTTEETIMWDTESGFMILKDGALVPVTETQIFGIAK